MSLVFLEAHTASGGAELDFTTFISGSYDDYEIHIVNLIPATNNVSILMQMDHGAGYDIGNNYNSNDFEFLNGATGTGGGGAGQSAIALARGVKNTSTDGFSGRFILSNPGSGALNKFVSGMGITLDNTGPRYLGWQIAGVYTVTTALVAIRILPSGGGNLSSGTVRIYGVSES